MKNRSFSRRLLHSVVVRRRAPRGQRIRFCLCGSVPAPYRSGRSYWGGSSEIAERVANYFLPGGDEMPRHERFFYPKIYTVFSGGARSDPFRVASATRCNYPLWVVFKTFGPIPPETCSG